MANITAKSAITGEISASYTLSGTVSTKVTLQGTIQLGVPQYEGSYEVTPAITEQVIQTGRRTMMKDITILGIPYQEVTNLSGGKTATIG